MQSLVVAVASITFHVPSPSAFHPTPIARTTTPTLFFSAERRISFSSLDNEQRILATLRTVANKASRWRDGEWRVLGAPPLQFSLRSLPDGVRLQYFDASSDAGRLVEDGATDVTLRDRAIVWTPSGRARRRNEDVLYRLLLHEVRDGALRDCCTLAPGLYPPSAGVARLVAKIDAACLVDKKGQYSRF